MSKKNIRIFGLSVALLCSGMVLFYLKKKIKREILNEINFWATIAVNAVEQMPEFQNKNGYEKKQYVMNFIQNKGQKIKQSDMEAIIESAVKLMNDF